MYRRSQAIVRFGVVCCAVQTGDLLRKKLTSRPDRQCLVQHHILEGLH